MNTWRESLACAAGFFNGEGHIGYHDRAIRSVTWRSRGLQLSISQVERGVLDHFRAAVGLGSVGGPYDRSHYKNHQDIFEYQVARFEHVQAIIAMLWPWLSVVKREQARHSLIAVRSRPDHQRICKYGHPRTPENTYWDN